MTNEVKRGLAVHAASSLSRGFGGSAGATAGEAVPEGLPGYRHIGIYASRCAFLRDYPALAVPAIERFEALEQLRALWRGHRIAVTVTEKSPEPAVDTPEDLEAVRRLFAAEGLPE